MKKSMAMVVVLGAAVIFMAGCGKKEEPAGGLGDLTKKAGAVASDAKASADKAAADAKVAADKAAADAKVVADKAAADAKKAADAAKK